jgi:MFS family permease
MLSLLMLTMGLLSFIVFTFMDKKLDRQVHDENYVKSADEEFRFKDILSIITNKGFILIALLCVFFYSSVFPFIKYATDLMIQKFSVADNWAGTIPGLLPFGTMLMTPFFGGLYDKKGRGATIMLIGAILLMVVHFFFSLPIIDHWFFAIILMIILGIAFSLVPAAMWPSVPKIIPERQLGTAYAIIFWLQNMIALMAVPYIIGWVLDKYCITGHVVKDNVTYTSYNYTLPMMIFTSFGIIAVLFAILLKREDKKKGYGIELPNIRK